MNNRALFHKELRSWIESVIRQRSHLVRSGKSRANTLRMLNIIQELENYLNTYPYATDKKISKFFLTYHQKIRLLLPGEGSGSQRKREREYYMYLSRTRKIISNETIHHRQLQ